MTAAQRQARRRRRRRAGLTVFKIEADAQALADVLTAGGQLAEWDSENPAEVEAALGRFVRAFAKWEAENPMEVEVALGRFLRAIADSDPESHA